MHGCPPGHSQEKHNKEEELAPFGRSLNSPHSAHPHQENGHEYQFLFGFVTFTARIVSQFIRFSSLDSFVAVAYKGDCNETVETATY